MDGADIKLMIEWGPCCFCGKQIKRNGTDPCRLTVSTANDRRQQVWFCHAVCFKSCLTDDPMMEPNIF